MKVFSDYYDNPNRIVVGVDVTTMTDLFEENWKEDTGSEFDWEADGDKFNEASRKLDVLIEEHVAKTLGHKAVAESYDDDTYVLTFWGDRDDPAFKDALYNLKFMGAQSDDWERDGTQFCSLWAWNLDFDGLDEFEKEYGAIGERLVDSVNVAYSWPADFTDGESVQSSKKAETRGAKGLKSGKTLKSSVNYFEDYDFLCEVVEIEREDNGYAGVSFEKGEQFDWSGFVQEANGQAESINGWFDASVENDRIRFDFYGNTGNPEEGDDGTILDAKVWVKVGLGDAALEKLVSEF